MKFIHELIHSKSKSLESIYQIKYLSLIESLSDWDIW